jgi:3-hydroxyisobutyrate dehydrogenase
MCFTRSTTTPSIHRTCCCPLFRSGDGSVCKPLGIESSPAAPERRVGFVGFGQMGGVLACRLRDAGHTVAVFDTDAAAGAAARSEGLLVADSVGGVAACADLLLLCLPDAAAVEQTIAGPGGLVNGCDLPALCIDLTSSLPATTRRMGELLAARGARLIDAPVSGGIAGAQAGRLTVMAGGDKETVEVARPVLSTFASNIIWSGPLGSGHAVKAFNNSLSAVSLLATAEAIAAGCAAGIAPGRCVEAINHGDAASENSEVKYPRDILSGSFSAGFRLALLHKDVAGACAIAAEAGLPVPMTTCVRDMLAAGLRELGPAADMTAIYQVIVPDADAPEPVPQDQSDALTEVTGALFGTLLLFSHEIAGLVRVSGIDLDRALSIFNLSSGRNSCTSALAAGRENQIDLHSERTVGSVIAAGRWAKRMAVQREWSLPLTSLALELWETTSKQVGLEADAWSAF